MTRAPTADVVPIVPDANTALTLLFFVGLINYIDRIALSILQVPIKADLGLSDAQLGMLTGFAFFVPYTVLSWPLGRLADRVKRKYVLAGVCAAWSLATALVSTVSGFGTLLLLRMGVAMGEAGCIPTSYSLLADYFAPKHRAKAIATFVLSFPIGTMVGLAGIGALGAAIGWRDSFLVIGLFGMGFAPVILIALREPRRGESDAVAHEPNSAVPSVLATMSMLWKLKSFRYMALGATLQAYVIGAILSWTPPFYVRAHGLSLAEVAWTFGILVGVGGGIGSYLGGTLAGRFGVRDPRWYAWLPALASTLIIPIAVVQFTIANAYGSLACGFFTALLMNVFLAPSYALTQSLVAANVRAFSSATLVASTAIVGSGLGPFVTGALSDFLILQYGMQTTSLRYAICAALPAAGMASWLFMRSAAALKEEEVPI
jgi:predicted MFS family arabinose efflux permease